MEGLTSGAQQVATWSTGDVIIYSAAVGIVAIGFAVAFGRAGVGMFGSVLAGLAIASAGLGIARSVHNYFHTASLEVPAVGPAPVVVAAADTDGVVVVVPPGRVS